MENQHKGSIDKIQKDHIKSTSDKKLPLSSASSINMENKRERTTSKNSSIFGSSPLRQRIVKPMKHGSGSISSRINIVTETCSFIPNPVASTFSLEVTQSPPILRKRADSKKLGDLGEAAQITTSCQENLDKTEILEDPTYTDTVKSNDSAASLLRRSFSLPPDYHFDKKRIKHAKEIFEDFYPQDETPVYDSTESKFGEGAKHREVAGFRQTMEDLLERPEYIDSLESSSSRKGLLAKAARQYAIEAKARLPVCPEDDEISLSDEEIAYEKKRYMKNLFILSASYMLLFVAFLSMRNLQSSINNDIGLISLCFMYASLFVSCIFTTTVVQRLRPKNTILVCFVGLVIYTVCNYYPHYYTLLPASAIAGFSLANSYTAQATYMTNIAASYAMVSGKDFVLVLTRFNGLYYMFFQLAQILGGVISSVVLKFGESSIELNHISEILSFNETLNQTVSLTMTHVIMNETGSEMQQEFRNDTLDVTCGAGYCPFTQGQSKSSALNPVALYTLVSIFTICGICGTSVLFFFLDPLEGEMKKSQSSLTKQLAACFRFFFNKKVVCLLPLMFYSLLQVSFMFGEYSKAFVTCSSGVHMVGYVMLTISTSCAMSSYANSKIVKFVDRKILLPTGYAIHLSMYVVMLFLKPTSENMYTLFIVGAIWGLADGIFVTQVITLIGVLFIHNKEPAFAGLKMCQAIAVCIFFFVSPYVCTSGKIYAMMIIAFLAAVGYISLEVILCQERKAAKISKPKFVEPISV